jgi:hypothetical protein
VIGSPEDTRRVSLSDPAGSTVGSGQRRIVVWNKLLRKIRVRSSAFAFRPECHRCERMIRGENDIQEDQ